MVVEIEQKEIEIQEGYVGNLSSEQEDKLRQVWQKFLDTCDSAADKANGGGGGGAKGGGDLGGWDEKKGGPDSAGIPKDDAAKDELKAKEEMAALDELIQQYGGSALRDTFWQFVKGDNPDTDVLRFLRARKWDVSRAFAMMAGCMKWRLDNNVEELVEKGDLGNASIEKFLDQQRSGKTYALGTTDNEQPICYIHVRKHLTWGQPGASLSKYVIYAMESFRILMVPPNDKVVLLFDMTGFGLKNMDWNCILFIVKCLEAYYPESLGTLYIHNAPWIFTGIWKLLGPMLDPAVRSKVRFTKKPADIDLVPAERLATVMGGKNVTEFEFIEPEEGENAKLDDQAGRKEKQDAYTALANEYEQVTRKWIESQGRDDKVTKQRELLTKKLRLAYFELDPYVRGLTVYHRNGTVDGQGIVTWEYKQKDGELYRHVVGKKYCAEALRMQIKDIEGGADPVEAEEKSASKVGAEAGGDGGESGDGAAAAGGAGAAATGAAAVAAADTPTGEDEFHEVNEATPEATKKAVDADTDKVQQHDAEAAKAVEAAEAKKTNGSATANNGDLSKTGGSEVTTKDVDDSDGLSKKGSIKAKTSRFGSKLKSVISPSKA